MTLRSYDPSSTMLEARSQYFETNHFGADGGYAEKWVDFKLGPIPFPFPNTPARVRAVRYHDLHHILTGYDTDLLGEFEISAWELGAGCRDFVAAWALNLGGLFTGLFLSPGRIWRAWVRGRHAHSLYGLPLEELLASTVGDVRRKVGMEDAPKATAADALLFVGATAAGMVTGLLLLALTVPLLPVGIATNVLRKRSLAASGS